MIDYRTGEVLAYVGSASYTAKGNETFQPQFDVLADGWRQPGSAIKPVGYAIGIEDKAITASTMLMDVVTDFGNEYTPTQADKLERGPVRVRSALQFSLNIPAIKASMITGLDRTFERSKDFGLTYPNTAIPVVSMGIGTLEVHPIDLLGAYGTIANGGIRAPRRVIQTVVDVNGDTVWPLSNLAQTGIRVISSGTAYIITDILAGNTDTSVNPYWGKWAINDGDTRRPAAYKTGTTSDNRDVAAYGFLAPPADESSPGACGWGLDGQQRQQPERRQAVARHLGAALVGDPDRDQRGAADRRVRPARRSRDAPRWTRSPGFKPGPFTRKTVEELFLPGTIPTQEETSRVGGPRSTRRPGCCGRRAVSGRRSRKGFFNLSEVEADVSELAEGQCRLGCPRGEGLGCAGRPGRHPDLVLLQQLVRPIRTHVGCAVCAHRALPDRRATGLLRSIRATRSAQPVCHTLPAAGRGADRAPGAAVP